MKQYCNFKFWILMLLFLLCQQNLQSQDTLMIDSRILYEKEILTDLIRPWELKWGPDDMLWVTEIEGMISRIDPISGMRTVVGDLSDDVFSFGEGGMLGMTFHHDFMVTPLLYVVYNYGQINNYQEKLISLEWDGDTLSNQTTLIESIPANGFHNGSRLLITEDEKILMTTGDSREPESAQDLESVSGKILRMNMDGTIPFDNPFPNSYVYTFGHRNPQGLAQGPNGKIYASEHGENRFDEFNLIMPGKNYGWPTVEGVCNTQAEIDFCSINNVAEPLASWDPCHAVNDIIFYDSPLIPELTNTFLMAILGGREGVPSITALKLNEEGAVEWSKAMGVSRYGRIRDVTFNPHTGSIYFVTGSNVDPNTLYELSINNTVSNEEILEEKMIQVFPNPMDKSYKLNIVVPNKLEKSIFEIFDSGGRLIKDLELNATKNILDVRNLEAGIYYYRVETKEGIISSSFVIPGF